MGLIYLDSCLLIYSVEGHPDWTSRVRAAMAPQDMERFAISSLVRMECLIKPLRQANRELQQRYERGLNEFVQLDLPESVYRAAANIRALSNLRTPDALHLACAQHHGCAALWTNDERMTQAGHGLVVNILR